MKLYELNNGEEFRCNLYNQDTEEVVLEISGKFLKMDGMYAQVRLHGVTEVTLLDASMEVEKENK